MGEVLITVTAEELRDVLARLPGASAYKGPDWISVPVREPLTTATPATVSTTRNRAREVLFRREWRAEGERRWREWVLAVEARS